MTNNSISQDLVGLLTGLSKSIMDTLSLEQTVTAQALVDQDDASATPGQILADDLNYFMSAVIAPIVCFLGITGNVLSIATWTRIGTNTSTGRYLTGQAAANIASLVMFLSCDSIHCWFPDVKYSPIYGEFFSHFGYPMFYFSVMCCVWFTVGVTVDRYIMVCWITKAKDLCSESRARFSLLFIAANGFIINIPHFIFYKPAYGGAARNSTEDGERTVAFVVSEFGSGVGGEFYEFWIHCMVLVLVPWLTVLVMNVRIIFQLHKANKMMAGKKSSEASEKSRKSENQITRLLLAVTFTFLLCNGLQCASHCMWLRSPPDANLVVVSATYAFGKTAMIFNASLNFLLYCLTGRRFRGELLKFLGLARSDGSGSSIVDSSSRSASTSTTATTTVRLKGS